MKNKPETFYRRDISVEDRFWGYVDKSSGDDECWEWTGAKSHGYGRFDIGKNIIIGAHRLAWTYTHGIIPDGLLVCHKCDNRGCCNPSHFFIGSHADNLRDARDKGRRPSKH